MASLDSIIGLNTALIAEYTTGVVLIGDSSAPLITAPFDTDGSFKAQPGYFTTGSLAVDGVTFGTAITEQTYNIWQTTEDVRSDVTSDKLTFMAKFAETLNGAVRALTSNLPIASVPALGSTAAINRPRSAAQPLRRALILSADESHQYFRADFLPAVKITAKANEQLHRAAPLEADMTFSAYLDTSYGTSRATWYGGAGWTALATTPAPVAII